MRHHSRIQDRITMPPRGAICYNCWCVVKVRMMPAWRTSLGFAALLSVGLALALPLPAQIPGAAQPAGEAFRNVISIEDKQVPLPPGEWYEAGRATIGTDARQGVTSVALVRLHGTAVDAAVLIQANRADS